MFTREECDMMIDALMVEEKELVLPHLYSILSSYLLASRDYSIFQQVIQFSM